MVGAKYLVVVLEVGVLFQVAYSEWVCNTSNNGVQTDFPVQLASALLPAGIRNFNVEIPNVCNQVGVSEEVCDYDSFPEVHIMSTMFATVRRTGFLFRDGIVTVKVYCPEPWNDSKLYGGGAPALKVKNIPESPKQKLDTQHSSAGRSPQALLTTADQARLQNQYGILRSAQDNQVDARQTADVLRQSTSTNARQAALGLAYNQAINNALSTAQTIDGRYGAMDAIDANTRLSSLDQSNLQARYRLHRSIQGTQVAKTRQSADTVRHAIKAQQAALHQSRLGNKFEIPRSAQGTQAADASQLADMLRKAKEANTREMRFADQTTNAHRSILGESAQRRIRRALQSSDASKAADVVREAKVDKAHQAVQDQVQKEAASESRSAASIANVQRKNQLLTPQKRLRRDLLSFQNLQAADGLQKPFISNARQAALEQTWNQAMNEALRSTQAVNARQGTDMFRGALPSYIRQPAYLEQTRNQPLNELLHNSDNIDGRQATDVVLEVIAANARQAAVLDQARRQALQLTGRTSELSQSIDAREGANIVREGILTNAHQAALEQTRNQALNEALRSAQIVDGRQEADIVRSAIEAKAALDQSRLSNKFGLYRSAQSTPAVNTRQSVDMVRQAKEMNARQTALQHTGHTAYQEAHEARLADQTNNAHRNILRESSQRLIRRALQTSDTSQADVVREAKADISRQVVLDQAQQQAAQEARIADPISESQLKNHLLTTQKRSRRALVSFENHQVSNGIQKALSPNQATLEQARNQALNQVLHSTQTMDARQPSDIVRAALAANARQAAALDQARRLSLQMTDRTSELSQSIDARQGADIVREGIVTNARQAALDHTRNEALDKALRSIQIADGRQEADIVRSALEANERQSVLDQSRLQTRHRIYRSAQGAQAADTRQSADMVRKAKEAITRRVTLDQTRQQGTHEGRIADQSTNARRKILRESTQERIKRASQSSDTSQVVDVVREAKADKGRQAILDQAKQQAAQEVRLADPISDAQSKIQLLTQKRTRRSMLSSDNLYTVDGLQKVLPTNARYADFEPARYQNIDEPFRTALDGQREDIFRNAMNANVRNAAFEQARRQPLRLTGRTEVEQGIDSRQAADVLREIIAANARQAAALEEARRQALQLTGRTSEVSQSIDARHAFDVAHEAATANARHAALIQAQEAQLLAQAEQSANNRYRADTRHGYLEDHASRYI